MLNKGELVFCLSIILFLVDTADLMVAPKSFVKTFLVNGTTLCAVGDPSLVISVNQWSVIQNGFGSCIPNGVNCAWRCTQDPSCTNFNYKEDLGLCELFYYTPTVCTIKLGCSHSQVICRGVLVTK